MISFGPLFESFLFNFQMQLLAIKFSISLVKKVFFLCQIFEMKILMDLHDLKSPEFQRSHFYKYWCVCACFCLLSAQLESKYCINFKFGIRCIKIRTKQSKTNQIRSFLHRGLSKFLWIFWINFWNKITILNIVFV